jgi:hypothetical protein
MPVVIARDYLTTGIRERGKRGLKAALRMPA